MSFIDFMNGLKWEYLRQRLLQLGIDPNDMAGVDFNNLQDLNQLASKIVPKLIKSNPNIANLIKQNSSSIIGQEKAKEVCKELEVIDVD